MDEAKEKFFQCHDDTKTAFEELCAMVDALNVSTYSALILNTRFSKTNGLMLRKLDSSCFSELRGKI